MPFAIKTCKLISEKLHSKYGLQLLKAIWKVAAKHALLYDAVNRRNVVTISLFDDTNAMNELINVHATS